MPPQHHVTDNVLEETNPLGCTKTVLYLTNAVIYYFETKTLLSDNDSYSQEEPNRVLKCTEQSRTDTLLIKRDHIH